MKKIHSALSIIFLAVISVGMISCSKRPAAHDHGADTAPHHHEHKPPHGGTVVVLGNEAYHLEFVLDATAGKLQAFVFDGELENFIRLPASSLEIETMVAGTRQLLVLQAVASSATGETVGDTSLFEVQADWLKSAGEFDAVLKSITIRGTTFSDVKFNFPKGNDAH